MSNRYEWVLLHNGIIIGVKSMTYDDHGDPETVTVANSVEYDDSEIAYYIDDIDSFSLSEAVDALGENFPVYSLRWYTK